MEILPSNKYSVGDWPSSRADTAAAAVAHIRRRCHCCRRSGGSCSDESRPVRQPIAARVEKALDGGDIFV
jgi:hypothetical protein